MSKPVLINACLTGMIPTKDKCPDVPITPEEIIAGALEAHSLGASIVHLHARGLDGVPTWDPGVYREIFSALRSLAPELILCATTSGRLFNEPEKRAAVLWLEEPCRPDMASLTLGSLNFPGSVSANSVSDILYLLDMMHDSGVKPEFEVFDLGMVDFLHVLMKKRKWISIPYVNILLGNMATAAADEDNLRYLVSRLPQDTVWAGAGIGKMQARVITWALALSGHVRVGLEDNIYSDHVAKTPTSNKYLIERVVEQAAVLGRQLLTPNAARVLLGLCERDKTSTSQ
jgi:uncharacterized protein (DUF849 family)